MNIDSALNASSTVFIPPANRPDRRNIEAMPARNGPTAAPMAATAIRTPPAARAIPVSDTTTVPRTAAIFGFARTHSFILPTSALSFSNRPGRFITFEKMPPMFETRLPTVPVSDSQPIFVLPVISLILVCMSACCCILRVISSNPATP